MSLSGYSLATSPLLPWWAIGAFLALALLAIGFGAVRRARGTLWRLLATAILAVILADPSLIREDRQPQRDVAVVVVDDSPSMRIGERRQFAATALDQVTARLKALPDLDLRIIHAGAPEAGAGLADSGTRLYTALQQAFADVPKQRIAGAVMITDGEVHDVPPVDRLDFPAPLHALLTGKPGEADRRLLVKSAPSFGLVGKEVAVTLRVDDLPDSGHAQGQVRVTIRKDGGQPRIINVPLGRDTEVRIPIDHGGPNVVEIEAERGPQELTLENNRAAFVVNGVRDRLKVLLVSGEPHQGERTWRNILKSDPSVDLIHFTILRPPEKQDGTPIRELSLIAFPIRELFDVKLDEFDLIIFDDYQRRGVLPISYLDNIVRFVRKGGAFLEASGPGVSPAFSLYRTPLGSVLPAEPTGQVYEQGFKPRVSEQGLRHPVTADLPGGTGVDAKDPRWGRWFRSVDATPKEGVPVMISGNDRPLLVLSRAGEGRVAQLLSDQMWLWTRGFEGGGPQAELLRRLVYWLMKEPDLEENALSARVEGNRLLIARQSLEKDDRPVQVTGPDGVTQVVPLIPESGGRSVATVPIEESGLYRVTDGTRTALAAAGALNPIEMSDVRTTDEKLSPITTATGGGIYWVGPGSIPDVRRVEPGRSASGRSWMGFRANGDYIVTGVHETPLVPGALALLLALGAFIAAWRREGR
ncbi:MAG TPA: hypothetical protein VMG55_20130 [Stellaceae bacterium]|nr:hypothetical protein [Stellaceae bacterium]